MGIRAYLTIVSMIFHFIKTRANDLILKKKLMLDKNIFVGPNVVIDPEYSWLISIGKNSYLTK